MNDRHSLHPAYVLFGVLSIIKGFLPLFLILMLKGFAWSETEWYWYAGAVGALLLAVLLCYLQWRRFGFWLEADRIVIRSGLLFREEKTIYYSRIHSVNVEQPLIQRILGVVQLKIETPGGNKKAEGILHTLSEIEANRIKEQLRSYSQGEPAMSARSQTEAEPQSQPVLQASLAGAAAHAERETVVSVDSGKLFQAAATSLNFGLAAAFIAGIYSFADDFMELLLPDRFFDKVVEDSVSLLSGTLFIVVIAILVIGFAWVLSIILYILKYSGFAIRREGQQVSISYGLLERKSILFDPKNAQAVIVNESWLRQPFGYGEVKLQVVSSDKQEQLMLHPFIKISEIQGLLDQCLPGMVVHGNEKLNKSPQKALLYYLRIPLLVSLVISSIVIVIFGMTGVWSLLIAPLVLWWRISCHRSAGLLLRDGQLTLRRRTLHLTTYYVRKPRIVTMKVNRSIAQKKRGLVSVSIHVLGSSFSYKVSCMAQRDVEPVWKWFSRRKV